MRAVMVALAVLVVVQAIGPEAVAAAVETCESHGLTYNCVTESVTEQDATIPYQDGTVGQTPTNTTETTFSTWPTNLTTEMGNVYSYIQSGVGMGAVHELKAKFFANNGSIALPLNETVVALGLPTTQYVVPVWSERIQFQATDIMNGASRMVWRSPLYWDANWTSHSLVIRDASTNEIVGGDTYVVGGGHFAGGQGAVVDGRVYHLIEAAIRTNRVYTFNEYVGIPGSQPGISSVDLGLGNGADLANDGNREFFLFAGTSGSIAYSLDESAWSAVFLRGIGDAGIERLVIGNSTTPNVRVTAQTMPGSANATVYDPNTVEVVLPFRMTTPLDVHLQLFVYAPGNVSFNSYDTYLHNVSGIANANFTITPTGAGPNQANWYQVEYSFNLTDGQALSYVMYDTAPASAHSALSCTSDAGNATCNFEFPQFSVWYEVHESKVASPPASGTASNHSQDCHGDNSCLVHTIRGYAEMVASFVFIAVGVAVAFVFSETIVGIGVGAAAVAAGLAIGAHARVEIAYGRGLMSTDDYNAAQDLFAKLGKDALAVIATGACLVSLLAAPAIGVPVCILAGLADLWALGVPVFEIIKNVVEVLAQLISEILSIIGGFLPILVALTVGLAIAYSIVVPVKFGLLFILGALGIIITRKDPRDWEYFRLVRNAFYLPIWNELIEEPLNLFMSREEKAAVKRAKRRSERDRAGDA